MSSTSPTQIAHIPQVASQKNWEEVSNKLLGPDFVHHESVESIVNASGCTGHLALRAPLAVASTLLESPSMIKDKNHLRVAILGAASLDSGVNGRLFGLVPHALGRTSLKLEVDLVGPTLSPTVECSEIASEVFPPATMHRMTVGQWWASTPHEQRPDLLFCFNPAMSENGSLWMTSSELPRILKSGIPLIVFSLDLDEAHRDALILESYGAQVVTQPRLYQPPNPDVPQNSADPFESFASATFTVVGFTKKPVLRAMEVAKQVGPSARFV